MVVQSLGLEFGGLGEAEEKRGGFDLGWGLRLMEAF